VDLNIQLVGDGQQILGLIGMCRNKQFIKVVNPHAYRLEGDGVAGYPDAAIGTSVCHPGTGRLKLKQKSVGRRIILGARPGLVSDNGGDRKHTIEHAQTLPAGTWHAGLATLQSRQSSVT
jgi:hypothetical protein